MAKVDAFKESGGTIIFDTRDALQQGAPGSRELLGVPQVARVLVGDGQLERMELRELALREHLCDVECSHAAILEMRATA